MIDSIDWKLVAAVVGLASNIGFLPYVWDILKKRTEPHAYTWLIWIITQGTAVAGVWHGGGGLGGLGLTLGLFLVTGVFLLCLKFGTKNITRGDTVVLIAALAAVLVWWQLDQPVLSVLMVAVIDVLGYLPTYRKSWEEPWSETISAYAIFALGNAASLLALDAYNLLTYPYLTGIMCANAFMVGLLLVRRRSVSKPV